MINANTKEGQAEIAAKVGATIDNIINKAIAYHASDIHIEPQEDEIKIRYRVDGQMTDVGSINKTFQQYIVSKIKVSAGMDISEKRVPQDGRMSTTVGDSAYTFRVATLPCIYGENIVLRILDQSAITRAVGDLGFPDDILQDFSAAYNRSNGIIFVTGPTGSGKTTTLYAVLNEINDGKKNIISIENPVEYELVGISQSQTDASCGMTFEKGLHAMLRLDPDVLMVGEIRDKETAKVATEAAMTGHMVLSTLHTNNATDAPARLIEMDIEPFLISNTIRAVLAQRLVRKLCENCKAPYLPDELLIKRILSYRPDNLMNTPDNNIKKQWQSISEGGKQMYAQTGCSKCNNLGYKGRVPVYELMLPHENTAQAILRKSGGSEIRQTAYENGMRTLLEDSLDLCFDGTTSIDEIFRTVV